MAGAAAGGSRPSWYPAPISFSQSLCTVGLRLIFQCLLLSTECPHPAGGWERGSSPSLGCSGDSTGLVCNLSVSSQLQGPFRINISPNCTPLATDLKLWVGTRITRWGLAKSRLQSPSTSKARPVVYTRSANTRELTGPHREDGSRTVKAMPPTQLTPSLSEGHTVHAHARVLQVLAAKKHACFNAAFLKADYKDFKKIF